MKKYFSAILNCPMSDDNYTLIISSWELNEVNEKVNMASKTYTEKNFDECLILINNIKNING